MRIPGTPYHPHVVRRDRCHAVPLRLADACRHRQRTPAYAIPVHPRPDLVRATRVPPYGPEILAAVRGNGKPVPIVSLACWSRLLAAPTLAGETRCPRTSTN